MNSEAYEYLEKKNSRWTDAIKRDDIFVGVGNVNNQVKLKNGQKYEGQSEDRSFFYELKENQIFAYGVLDGFNGTKTVDYLDQFLLSNIYLDYLGSLQANTDEEIYHLLENEFLEAEQLLYIQSQDVLRDISIKKMSIASLRKTSPEYVSIQKEIKELNKELKNGAFGVISLIIDDRLFVSNVGTCHCFVFSYDQSTREKKITKLETEHSLDNSEEVKRLIDLKVNLKFDDSDLKHTRCIGDFNTKINWFDYPQFGSCQRSPIICQPEHPKRSFTIDETFLFMALYTDGVVKAIKKLGEDEDDPSKTLALKILSKIKTEPTLNSAAQCVLDEIKRTFDDKFSESREREDFTLLIRSFHPDLKRTLQNIESQRKQSVNETLFTENSVYEDNNTFNQTLLTDTESLENTNVPVLRSDQDPKMFLDENNNAIPYLNFDEFEALTQDDEEIKKFCLELEVLASNDSNA